MWRSVFLALGSLLIPAVLPAADHWLRFTSGPFEVLTDAGDRAGRETLVRFLEFRHALGQIIGEQDLQTPLPVRILVLRNPQGWTTSTPVALGRDRYNIVLPEKGAVPAAVQAELTRLFLAANTTQMPPAFERGLIQFFSTLQVDAIHITAGAPPPKPDLDWARIHLLIVDPEYYGRIRVLLYNLRHGVAPDAAYRNAFNKPPDAIEAQAKQHLAAGNFQTTSLSSLPMAAKDFPERPVSDTDARLARADLLAGSRSADEYRALLNDGAHIAEAHEGLGLLALQNNRPDEARAEFAAAIEAGSNSARAFIEYAKLEPDNQKASQALLKAAGINPKLDEPFVLLARRDTDPRLRLAHWKAATERNPRNPDYWQALAECYLSTHDYSGAAKAWTQAEQSATDPALRDRFHQARLAVEQQRLDYEADEKRRQSEEDARDIEKLKAEARARVHAAEVAANGGVPSTNPAAVPWWEGPQPDAKLTGTLTQIDCLGKQLRLVLLSHSKTVKLLIADPSKIVLSGGGEQSLACGPQKRRAVSIEYWAKPNARLGTAGEVATIDFQ
jgi:hypothetical protein